jgi:hypothetical protein
MKTFITLIACLVGISLNAQAPPELEKPGEHHRHLKMMVGTWDVKSKMFMATGQVMEGTFTEVTTLQSGGFWLIANFTGKFMGTPFHGHSVLGYDAHKKQYTGVWVDSFASVMMHSTGHCEKNGKLNIMIGSFYDRMQKRKVTMKQITEIKDANTKIFRMFDVQGKKETLIMEAVYKRRALEKIINGPKFIGPFTHTIADLGGVHYYLGGPQQARPSEGKFKPGTRVRLVRGAGSYSVVQSETGITAHVATAALKKINK